MRGIIIRTRSSLVLTEPLLATMLQRAFQQERNLMPRKKTLARKPWTKEDLHELKLHSQAHRIASLAGYPRAPESRACCIDSVNSGAGDWQRK